MPRIKKLARTEPMQPEKAYLGTPGLTAEDEASALGLAAKVSNPRHYEVVYTRARSLQEFTPETSIWSHLRGRNIDIWVETSNPADPVDVWDSGWLVLANDTGLLYSSTGRMWFRPWSQIVQLSFEPEQDISDAMYDTFIRELQEQKEEQSRITVEQWQQENRDRKIGGEA